MKFIKLAVILAILVSFSATATDKPVENSARPPKKSEIKAEEKALPKEDLLKPLPTDVVLGKDDAKVTIIEYSSLTCHHCGDFHNKTLPTIIKEYVDAGKVKYINRDYPLNEPALKAAIVARCDKSQYYKLIKTLYKNQDDWAHNREYMKILKITARMAGLKPEKIDACLEDKKLAEEIVTGRLYAEKSLKVSSTPTIYINSNLYEGDRGVETLKAALDKLLK